MIDKLLVQDLYLRMGVKYDVYNDNGYTVNTVLVQIINRLNECIQNVNDYTQMVEEFKDWVYNNGLQDAVNKKLEEMINDGTFDNIINQKLFKDLNDLVLITLQRVLSVVEKDAVIDYGLKPNQDNTEAFKDMIMSLPSNTRLNIPKGEYIINLTDQNVTKFSNGYCYVIKNDVNNITIGGEGVIVVNTSNTTVKNWLLDFYDCEFIRLKGLKVRGDFESVQGQVVRDSFPNGIVFEKSDKIFVNDCYMSRMFAILSTTGNGASPSTTIDVANYVNISNNIFENYGQISTYGGGASEYIFTDNIIINPLQTGLKISRNPLVADLTKINSKNFIVSDNTITWTSDFKFGIPSWSTSTTYSPCGIMVEAKSDGINITNNAIDMGMITQDLPNPIQTIGCIIVYKGGSTEDMQVKRLLIEGNNCNCYKLQADISISPYAMSTNVLNNVVKNGISLVTFGQVKQKGCLLVKGNTIEGGNGYIPVRCSIDNVTIENNTFSNTTNSIIEVSESTTDIIKICNNDMGSIGTISTIGDIICKSFFVTDNKSINTATVTVQAENVNIVNNHTKGFTTHYIISVGNETRVFFNGNYGECSSILNLRNGYLHLGANPLRTQSSVLYTLTNVTVMSGELLGGGAPSFRAFRGVTYIDLNATNDMLYIQVDAMGTNWKKITYA